MAVMAGIWMLLQGRSAAGGGATFGAFLGLLVAGGYAFLGHGWSWSTVGYWAVVCAWVGLIFDVVHLATRKRRP